MTIKVLQSHKKKSSAYNVMAIKFVNVYILHI